MSLVTYKRTAAPTRLKASSMANRPAFYACRISTQVYYIYHKDPFAYVGISYSYDQDPKQ